jgi:hypothetical protein
MAKSNKEVTSAKAASAAAKVLSNPNSSKAAKTAAASALTQRRSCPQAWCNFVTTMMPGRGEPVTLPGLPRA